MTTKLAQPAEHVYINPNAAGVFINPKDYEQYDFTVDGELFPWYLEHTPIVTRLTDRIWAIKVDILCLDSGPDGCVPDRCLPFTTAGVNSHTPVIGGVEFPWSITHDGYTFTAGCKTFPTVSLSFLAYNVDIEGPKTFDRDLPDGITKTFPINDARWVFDADANLWDAPQ